MRGVVQGGVLAGADAFMGGDAFLSGGEFEWPNGGQQILLGLDTSEMSYTDLRKVRKENAVLRG